MVYGYYQLMKKPFLNNCIETSLFFLLGTIIHYKKNKNWVGLLWKKTYLKLKKKKKKNENNCFGVGFWRQTCHTVWESCNSIVGFLQRMKNTASNLRNPPGKVAVQTSQLVGTFVSSVYTSLQFTFKTIFKLDLTKFGANQTSTFQIIWIVHFLPNLTSDDL